MSNVTEYKKITAFHPGYYIADIINDMGITQAEFATRVGTNEKTLSYLVNGQANITNDLAKKLSVMLGTSEKVWLDLQCTYDQQLIEIQKEKDFDEQTRLARMIDYKYFIDVAGLESANNTNEKITNLCKYFKVADLRILLSPDFLVSYQTDVNSVNEKNVINSRAWVQTAINISNNVQTKPYNSQKLKTAIPEIKKMTTQKPEKCITRLEKIFAESGVAFVILPNLKNSGVNGAVKWVKDDRVVLAMNEKSLNSDSFWFLLFHEIKHVMQRKVKKTFISYNEEKMIEENQRLEEEADKFAANCLITT